MIVVAYQRTQAGAMRRMAERRRLVPVSLALNPAPKPAPAPIDSVVTYLAVRHALDARLAASLVPKPDKPPYIAVEPVPLSSPRKIIAKVVGWHPGITVEDVLGKSRQYHIIPARFDAIVAVYENCRIDGRRYSLLEIGRAFGGMDHTSILHCLRKRGIPTGSHHNF